MFDSIKTGGKVLVFGAGAMVAVIVGVFLVGPKLFDLGSPFSTETVDRTPPVVLTEISDLAEFRAAEAQFEVLLDKEDDVRWVPDFIAGERVQYVAVGSIDATVDFSRLTEESIVFDESTGKAVIYLPAPTLGQPVIDFDSSGVLNRDRGVLDRIGGAFVDSPTGEESLVVAAGDKMLEAVPATDLSERAEANTEKMLETLLGAVGVESVDVIFEEPPVV
ncbi:MAG: DUF4230 domain-containing protein [Ilumatobacter sp.]|uniref:DUF4230 domain-containing protein n=1 Tax=Ilumatobacter sp. TaxID=1967498 RepID=UPI0032970625